jgi:V8-like Glu-specific endopeptidase
MYNATASLISANVLIGAGHSFRERFFSKIKSLTIYVGRHKENEKDTWLFAKTYKRKELKITIPMLFQKRSDPDYDYAYVSLPENISRSFFKLTEFEKIRYNTDSIFISGYPGDKGNKELWKKGELPDNIFNNEEILLYSIYTYVADSGAPLWCKIDNDFFIVGVHGTGNYHNGSCNASAKLTQKRILELQKFIADNRK